MGEVIFTKDWKELEQMCLNCKKCDLCKTRTNVVFGYGNIKSKVMFIGEGPGQNEDLQGKPFVGRSGKLLDSFLEEIGLNREKIYIANIVKCRPPDNRDPFPEEQAMCINWLRNQVYILRPKIIVALGRIAAMKIVDQNIKITRDHGIFVEKNNVWLMATLHPAAVLRNMSRKPDVQLDFKKLKDKIGEVGDCL